MFVGIDIGGTNTRIVTSESLDDVTLKDFASFDTPKNFETGLEAIINTIKDFEIDVKAIGIGLPGSISQDGILDGSTNLPEWVGKPLKQELEIVFNCPVHVKNDAEIGALGEAYFGQTNKENFFYVTWGTGVGCAQIFWEVNHAVVDRPDNRQPIYDLESKIGGNDIEKRFTKCAKELNDDEWKEVLSDLSNDLPTIVQNYGFNTIVIGGGIAVQKKEQITQTFENRTDIKVLVTNLEGKAGLYGALALVKNSIT